jgi:two-component system, sensor histidine kinase and response regulator
MQKSDLSCKTLSAEDLDSLRSIQETDAMTESTIPSALIGDKLRLQQILINLIKNALKFTISGRIKILLAFDPEAEMLKVKIADSGKGIKTEEMTRLFSMFGKLKRTASLNSDGIGMGLMICQNLVKMNHGSIEAYSDGEN